MTDEDISKVLDAESEEFKALKGEHQSLKEKIAEFKLKVHLTPEEELEKKDMQKQKLVKKDRMAELIRDYKQAQSA